MEDFVRSRMRHCANRISQYGENFDMTKDSVHKGWSKGYWEGRLSAFEDILDNLNSKENERMKS